ncbi:MAG: HAD family phosphatase [Bacillales bacterium]|nr:HAD family phosphatase [Bacillales bacterium]
MIKGVIFDLDGTILDDEKFTISSKIIEGKKLGYKIKKEDVIKSLGLSKNNSKQLFTSIYGEDFPYEYLAKKRFEYIVKDMKDHGMKLKPYTKLILKYLKKHNIKTCLCTSSEQYKIDEYKKYGDIFSYFDFIITGDLVKNGKPSPDIFILGRKRMQLEKEEVIVIEDASSGVKAALNGGFKVIMIPDLCQVDPDLINDDVVVLKNLYEAKCYINHQLNDLFVE